MAKTNNNTPRKPRHRKSRRRLIESDSTYLLKLVALVILATLWLKFKSPIEFAGLIFNGFPFGLVVGLYLVHRYEKNINDRKIWYATLIVVSIICYFVPAGIVI